jgi:magnesium chelatase accessory protein
MHSAREPRLQLEDWPFQVGRAAKRLVLGAELDWTMDGAGWPNREASRFVTAGGLRWHVQQLGTGPTLLLLHGTGAATHSWRELAPLLAEHFTVVAPDLPGHGFTEAPEADGYSLPAMSRALEALLEALDLVPAVTVGHSAGAAIACRMSLDGAFTPDRIFCLNGALLPLGGHAESWFAQMARAISWTPLLPRLLAQRGRNNDVIVRMLRGTGSRLDDAGVRLYGQLMRNPHHVASALRMMASWELKPLVRDLPRLQSELTLIVGDRDRYISPGQAREIMTHVPQAQRVVLRGLGHLAHEERPQKAARLISTGALPMEDAPFPDRQGAS